MSALRGFDARRDRAEAGVPAPKVPKPPKVAGNGAPTLGALATLGGDDCRSGVGPALTVDLGGVPCVPCPTCRSGAFHAPPDRRWRCSGCAPPELPAAEALAGWRFAHVPGPAETAAVPADPDALPVSPLGLRTFMEETCAEELAVVRLLAGNVPSPEVLADEAELTLRGEPLP